MFEFILFLVLYVLFLFDMELAVVKGQLYGTINTISRKIIEVYDEETDTWKISSSRKMPTDGVGFGQGTD